MSEDADHQPSFAETGLIALDRIQRTLEDLRTQLRLADEYLLRAHATDRGSVIVERVTVDNKHVQSISALATRDHGGHVTVMVAHRGASDMTTIPAGSSVEFEL